LSSWNWEKVKNGFTINSNGARSLVASRCSTASAFCTTDCTNCVLPQQSSKHHKIKCSCFCIQCNDEITWKQSCISIGTRIRCKTHTDSIIFVNHYSKTQYPSVALAYVFDISSKGNIIIIPIRTWVNDNMARQCRFVNNAGSRCSNYCKSYENKLLQPLPHLQSHVDLDQCHKIITSSINACAIIWLSIWHSKHDLFVRFSLKCNK
jgi:hypothetical protein